MLEVQPDELSIEVGAGIAESILRKSARRRHWIPDFEWLQAGDIVLSRSKTRPGKKPPAIERHQRTIPRLQKNGACSWTHAMLYVGRLHVAESTTFFKTGILDWRTGIRISPLIADIEATDLLICRRKDFQQTAPNRNEAVAYALLDHAVHRRPYGFDRIASIALSRTGIVGRVLTPLFRAQLTKAIICSEYALECLATAELLTSEYASIGNTNFFYPGDFHAHRAFDHIEMRYRQLKPV